MTESKITDWLVVPVGILALFLLASGCQPHFHIGGKYYMSPEAVEYETAEPDALEENPLWDSLPP